MKQAFRRLFNYLYGKYMLFKGARRIYLPPTENIMPGELTVVSIHGYELTIFCKEIKYRAVYKNSIVPDKVHFVYELFAKCTSDAPDILKRVTQIEVYLPRLTPTYVDWETSKKALVAAYLDILISRLKGEVALDAARDAFQ